MVSTTIVKSNREQRRQLAEDRIPDFVSDLRGTLFLNGRLTSEQVRKLYNEYRQFHGSPDSYPMDYNSLSNIDRRGRDNWSDKHLLDALQDPRAIPRLKARKVLAVLYDRFATEEVEIRVTR